MKKPVPNKIIPAFDDRAADSAKARRSFLGSSASKPDRITDPRLKPPKIIYKRCRQAIVESMAERLSEDDVDRSIAGSNAMEHTVKIPEPQPLQEQPQQQQQAEDHSATSAALRERAESLSKLRWAALKYKKVLDS